MRTTISPTATPSWYIVDATGETLGRLSTRVAHVLAGKHKVTFSPHQLGADHVVIVNASKVALEGKKSEQKEYFSHSGYFGSLRRMPFALLFKRDPADIIERAVRGMLPRNRLRKQKMKFLHVFPEAEHPHAAQQPKPLSSATQI